MVEVGKLDVSKIQNSRESRMMHQPVESYQYCLGVAYWDWPMGRSPWYQEDAVTNYTWEEAVEKRDRLNREVEIKASMGEIDRCNYPVWSIRIRGQLPGMPDYRNILCDEETGQPLESERAVNQG